MKDIEKWRKAGKIAAEALEYGQGLIKKDSSYTEVSEKIEKKIKELGGIPAFPVQMALNETAAHFTTEVNQDIKFSNELVSLDVGVHVDGCIGDNAATVDLSGKYSDLVRASKEAVDNAIKIIQVGTTLGEIGKVIQETINSYGFAPVKNLSGHGLDLYNIHTYPTIPNYDTSDKTKLKKGAIIAIEPFATNGAGIIYEGGNAVIFNLVNPKPVRSQITRKVLKEIIEKYGELPFCTRWLSKKFSLGQVKFALRELRVIGAVKEYPPLIDKNKGMVSQAEHTLLVDDKVEVLTKL